MAALFQLPTRIHIGRGVADDLPDHARELGGSRVCLISDPGVRRTGLLDRFANKLRGESFGVLEIDEVSANPRDHECDAAAEQARDFGADLIVGLGGGSPLDVAKAVAALITNRGRVNEWEAPRLLEADPVPMIAIPTTAGTGSEVTFYSVITDTARKFKMSLFDTRLAPRVALVDSLLTVSVPPRVTAATGMDALTHAIEAYTCTLANPVSDALALQAIRLIAKYLERAVADGSDLEARDGMMTASLVAGMSFGNADVAAVHCLAEAIGGLYDTPHGVANSIFLPVVFGYNAEAEPDRHAEIAEALGISRESGSAKDASMEAASALASLAGRIGIPRFTEIERVDRADFDRLAGASAVNVSNPSNCRQLDKTDYRELLERAWNA